MQSTRSRSFRPSPPDGGHIDDRTALADVQHLLYGMFAAEEHAARVNAHHALPFGKADILHLRKGSDARVAHEKIDVLHPFDELFHCRFHP